MRKRTGHPHSQACPGKSMVRLTDHLDMTMAVDWDIKPQTKQAFRCIYPAYKCLNNCRHFKLYERDEFHAQLS